MLLGTELEKAQLDSAYGIYSEILATKESEGRYGRFQ